MWGLAERKTSRFGGNMSLDDVYDQLDALRGYVQDLSRGVSSRANSSYGHARDFASDTAQEAEELMKDNLAASLVLALGLGVAIGYLISRSGK
jgi:ElaB/YqjD/DUF883 family membrane-anchored ribosome-binding protein